MTSLINPGATQRQVAQQKITPDQINSIYQSAYGRAGDEAGINYWLGVANNPDKPVDLNTLTGYIAGGANNTADIAAQIKKDYTGLLGRTADTAGLNYWTEQYNKGLTGQALIDAIKAGVQTGTDDAAALSSFTNLADADPYAAGGWNDKLDPNKVTGTGNVDFVNGQWVDNTPVTPSPPPPPPPNPEPSYETTAPQAPYTPPIPVTTSAPAPAAVAEKAVAATPYDAAQAQVVNAKTKDWTIDPTKTSAGLLSEYLNPDSPLMVQARAEAMRTANKRGLINSSLAASAGESAMIDKATPLATNDANLYGQSGQFNANAFNTAELNNSGLGTNVNVKNAEAINQAQAQAKGAQTQVSITNAGLGTDVSKFNSAQTQQNQQFNASAANTAALTTAQLTNQTSIANMQAAANLQLQQIQSSTSMSIAEKQIASQQLITNLNNASALTLANIQKDTTLTVAEKQAATQTAIATSDQANRIQVARIQEQLQRDITAADGVNKLALQNIQTNTSKDLAYIQANYQTLIQTSASLSDSYKSTLAGIAGILADASVDAKGKANVINGLMGNFKVMATAIGSINGVDVSKLLDFGTASVPA